MKYLWLLCLLLILTSYGYCESLNEIQPKLGTPLNFKEEERAELIIEKSQTNGFESLTKEEKEVIYQYEECPPFGTGTAACSWYCGGGPNGFGESSHLASSGDNKYSALQCHDFNLKTAWIEGESDYGIGEYIEFYFAPFSPRVNQIQIFNGYQKSASIWENNSRVKKLKLYINNKPYAILKLEDTTAVQLFNIDPIRSTVKDKPLILKLEILEVYPGKKWKDVAISEINFDGLDVHCFVENTKILMADYSQKNIQDIKVGDFVLSFNESNNTFEAANVLELETVLHSELIKIIFEDNSCIISTDDHPYFSEQGWLSVNVKKTQLYKISKIKKLTPEDSIIDYQLRNKKIKSILQISQKTLTYGIIKLSKNHAYIADSIIVSTEELK